MPPSPLIACRDWVMAPRPVAVSACRSASSSAVAADEVRVGLGQVVLGDGGRRLGRHLARRRARRRLAPAEARQVDDDAFARTVAEGALLGIATWVGEREAGHSPRRRGRGIGHAPGADRPGDVLERELAQVREAEVELAADLVVHLAGDADTAWLGHAFQPGGDVDPVAVDVLALDDHVADVDADPEPDALGRGQVQLAPGHARLDRHRAGHRLDDGSELAQGAVTRQVDDPAAVLGEERLDELLAVRLEALERALLVLPHQPRVADHVGRQDGGEPARGARRRHDGFRRSGDDAILGFGGNNSLFGNGGNDGMAGGSGNDFIDGGAGDDAIDGGSGIDSIFGGLGNDTIDADDGNDTANGFAGNDTIDGGLGDDLLLGGTDNDNLAGGSGLDTLRGGVGTDTMSGGLGNDIYDFNSTVKSVVGTARDVISAFSDNILTGQDVIDVSTIDANTRALGNQAFSFVVGAFTNAAQLRVIQNSDNLTQRIVELNTDTDDAAEAQILVAIGGSGLDATDFFL